MVSQTARQNLRSKLGEYQQPRKGHEGRGDGEEVNPEVCFYGGAFPLSQYSKEQEVSGDFLPKQSVCICEKSET